MQDKRQVIFITGTDTGVGKTMLTALLLTHLRRHGQHALALKPFCSGGRQDVELLGRAQEWEIPREQINPFYFRDPVAPLVAARRQGISTDWIEVLRSVRTVAETCRILLVEGVGGLLVPLVEKHTVADLITALRCRVIVVARNKLGAVNHTLLTIRALGSLTLWRPTIVLMGERRQSIAAEHNASLITEFAGLDVLPFPFLEERVRTRRVLERVAETHEAVLAQIVRLSLEGR